MTAAKRRRFPNLLGRLWATASAELVQIRRHFGTAMENPLAVWLVLVFLTIGSASSAHAQDSERAHTLYEDTSALAVLTGGTGGAGGAKLDAVLIADLDGDHVDDLILGARGADLFGRADSGAVYVLYGRDSFHTRRSGTLSLNDPDSYDLRIAGGAGFELGAKLGLGDIDGDRLPDLIIGAPGAAMYEEDRGSVFVVFGRNRPRTGTVDLLSLKKLQINGYGKRARTGFNFHVADLDLDGYDDLLVASIDQIGKQVLVHAVLGRRFKLDSLLSLRDHEAASFTLGLPMARSPEEPLLALSIGDFNGDLLPDLAAAISRRSWTEKVDTGVLYLLPNIRQYPEVTLDRDHLPDDALILEGNQTGALMGANVVLADVGGDRFGDVIVASPKRLLDGPDSEGLVHILWGVADMESGRHLMATRTNHIDIAGLGPGELGTGLVAQDVNGDNTADLLMTTPLATTGWGKESGAIEIAVGGSQLLNWDRTKPGTYKYNVRIAGDYDFARIGSNLALGDLDGSGFPDLAVTTEDPRLGVGEAGAFTIVADPFEPWPDRDVSLSEVGTTFDLVGPERGSGFSAKSLLVGDLTGSGKPELVVVTPHGAEGNGVICVLPRDQALFGEIRKLDLEQCTRRVVLPPRVSVAAITVADVGHDGRADLVLGLPDLGYDRDHINGAVVVIPGEWLAGSDDPLLDLAETTSYERVAVVWGPEHNGGTGTSIAVVDVTGDGVVDLVVGSPFASTEEREQVGRVDLLTGPLPAAGTTVRIGSSKLEPTSTWLGAHPGSHLGLQVGALDWNADGHSEVWLRALSANPEDRKLARSGSVYLVALPTEGDGPLELSDEKHFLARYDGPGPNAGLRVVSGDLDLNGDGRGELIFLSPWATELDRLKAGALYVVAGTETLPSGVLSLSDEKVWSARIVGPESTGNLSDPLALSLADDAPTMLLSCPSCLSSHEEHKGAVVAFDLPTDLDRRVTVDLREAEATRFRIDLPQTCSRFGLLATSLDLDGDDLPEVGLVFVGSEEGGGTSGRLVILKGKWLKGLK